MVFSSCPVRCRHRPLDFYVDRLGFTKSWRYEEEGNAFVAQVDRQGCALILSSQWPDKVGKGLMFISLGIAVAMDKLRAELESGKRIIAVLEFARCTLPAERSRPPGQCPVTGFSRNGR
jgi:hypothetical protein